MSRIQESVFVKVSGICACFAIVAGVVCFFWYAETLFSVAIGENTSSMNPSLLGGYVVLVSSTAYDNAMPVRGDVVVFWDADPGEGTYIARATPCFGDETRSGVYKDWFAKDPDQPFICVAPDNQEQEFADDLSPVPLAVVRGKAVFIIKPRSAVGFIPKWPDED